MLVLISCLPYPTANMTCIPREISNGSFPIVWTWAFSPKNILRVKPSNFASPPTFGTSNPPFPENGHPIPADGSGEKIQNRLFWFPTGTQHVNPTHQRPAVVEACGSPRPTCHWMLAPVLSPLKKKSSPCTSHSSKCSAIKNSLHSVVIVSELAVKFNSAH